MFIPIHRQVKGIGQELISVFHIGRDLFHPVTNTQINCIFKKDSERKKKNNLMLYFLQPIKSPEPNSDFIQVKPEAAICLLYRASPQLRHC